MRIHIVIKGDTLKSIAQKYNIDYEEIVKLNAQLSNPDMIYPGMKIKVPERSEKPAPLGSQKEVKLSKEPKPSVALEVEGEQVQPVAQPQPTAEQPKPAVQPSTKPAENYNINVEVTPTVKPVIQVPIPPAKPTVSPATNNANQQVSPVQTGKPNANIPQVVSPVAVKIPVNENKSNVNTKGGQSMSEKKNYFPGSLVSPSTPSPQVSPMETGKPNQQVSPVATGKPNVQVSPVATGKPNAQVSPIATGKPNVQVSPVATGKPNMQVSPVATGKPNMQVSPVATGKPNMQVSP
ncbi:SafA/ExsA family spore coat assembly protein, partial [Gottfriedia acidiceleris]|uniref:LysM peptidoglycan-binding domain-containing protein n=1 Tax=Gottfriedia acidiceleris TaxID=371036 RepID=UPI0030008A3E